MCACMCVHVRVMLRRFQDKGMDFIMLLNNSTKLYCNVISLARKRNTDLNTHHNINM